MGKSVQPQHFQFCELALSLGYTPLRFGINKVLSVYSSQLSDVIMVRRWSSPEHAQLCQRTQIPILKHLLQISMNFSISSRISAESREFLFFHTNSSSRSFIFSIFTIFAFFVLFLLCSFLAFCFTLCVCLFATGLKKGEGRGQTMSRYSYEE